MISNSEFAKFAELNLDPVKIKLMHESGEGWSPERTTTVETEYRRFLYLAKAFPQEQNTPSVDVDTFWHYHILDTVKYGADCEQLFGYFLHHFPYGGMGGEADRQALERMATRTAMLYERTFGVRYPGTMAEATEKARAGKVHTVNSTWLVKEVDTGTVHAAYCFASAGPTPRPGAGTVRAAYCFVTAPGARQALSSERAALVC
jgi:hypothetical protein